MSASDATLDATAAAHEPMVAPFAGWLVKPDWSELVISRAYDNLTAVERRTIVAQNPYSYVNVTRSREDLADDEELSLESLVRQGAAALKRLLDAEAFVPTGRRALYLYRMTHAKGTQTGVLCTVPVAGFAQNRIRIHENVQAERTELLTAHILGVGATSNPVSLTVRESAALESALEEVTSAAPAELEFGSEQVRHEIWTVPAASTKTLTDCFAGESLYVADGHHRSAAAEQALAREPDSPALSRALAVVFPASQLHVEAFHRIVADRRHAHPGECLTSLAQAAELVPVRDAAEAQLLHRGEVGVYQGGSWFRLTLGPASKPGALAALDVERLRRQVLVPVFGADEMTTRGAVDYLPDPAGMGELMQRCDASGRVGFVMHPVSVAELMDVADEASLMPPKSSFFSPKPRSGVFLRILGRGATAHMRPS